MVSLINQAFYGPLPELRDIQVHVTLDRLNYNVVNHLPLTLSQAASLLNISEKEMRAIKCEILDKLRTVNGGEDTVFLWEIRDFLRWGIEEDGRPKQECF